MNTPKTNEALATLLERDGELSEDNAPEVLVKLSKRLEGETEALREQLARSQEAGVIWYRRCSGEDPEWEVRQLSKLRSALIRINDAVVARMSADEPTGDERLELLRASEHACGVLHHGNPTDPKPNQ